MSYPKLLVFVRHAESEGNVRSAEERALFNISQHSYALTERGKQQVAITGKYLHERFGDFDVFYRSYYTRAKQTLEIMYPDARVYEDARLAERQGGIWQTMTSDQVQARFPEELTRKEREGLYHYRPFGGENWPDVELRIQSFLDTLYNNHGGKRILCIVHEHWFILLQRLLHHLSVSDTVEKFKHNVLSNAGVTIYESASENGAPCLILLEHNIVPWKKALSEPELYRSGVSN